MRAIFADEIYKKYLKIGASHRVQIPAKDLEYIETLLEAREFIHCFDDLKSYLFKEIDRFFQGIFLKSSTFTAYTNNFRLPPFLTKECAKKKEEKKKEAKKMKEKDKDEKR